MSLIFPNVGEAVAIKKWAFGKGTLVTGATNATPIVLTVPSGHPFKVGDQIAVSDVGGNTAANGTFYVSAVAATTVTLTTVATTTNVAGNGAYTSGGSASVVVENRSLKLFSNNITPAQTDTAGTYTEATFTGYSAKTLTSKYSTVAAWGTPTAGNPEQIAYPQQSWTSTSAQTIYGYFVVGSDSTTLEWSEAFSSSKNLSASSDVLNLTPQVTLQ